jgi:hypothetical protein
LRGAVVVRSLTAVDRTRCAANRRAALHRKIVVILCPIFAAA